MARFLLAAALSGLIALPACSEGGPEEADPAKVDAAVERAEVRANSAKEAAVTNAQERGATR